MNLVAKMISISSNHMFISVIYERDTIRGVKIRAGAVYVYIYMYGGTCGIRVARAMHT